MAALGVPSKVSTLLASPCFSVRSYFAGLNLTLKIFSMPSSENFDKILVSSYPGDVALISAILIKNKMLNRKFNALRVVWREIRDGRESQRWYKYLSALPPNPMGETHGSLT